MGRSGVGEKVIKPPVERVVSGKIFKPSRAFRQKLWIAGVTLAVAIWLVIAIGYIGIISMVAFFEPSEHNAIQHITIWFIPLSLGTIVFDLIWLIPYMTYVPFYFKSIEYSVKAESGETMPEIYVKKGIVTVTRKHVPFRTITNISSKAGPFDRLFGIGSVLVETAGYSGTKQTGPEIKLEGIVFYEEIRDFILNELRKFREPYVIGTEVVRPFEEPVPRMEGLDDEILITLREIRDILESQKKQK